MVNFCVVIPLGGGWVSSGLSGVRCTSSLPCTTFSWGRRLCPPSNLGTHCSRSLFSLQRRHVPPARSSAVVSSQPLGVPSLACWPQEERGGEARAWEGRSGGCHSEGLALSSTSRLILTLLYHRYNLTVKARKLKQIFLYFVPIVLFLSECLLFKLRQC